MNIIKCYAVMFLSLALAAPALAASASRTRLLTSPNPARAGAIVQLHAEVDGLGGGAPAGTVRFSEGSVALGAATLTPYGAGQATLAGGDNHSCALATKAGPVRCWGWNKHGQIGDHSTKDRRIPVPVRGLPSDVIAITAGVEYSCALTSAGAVKCWGYNHYGQLGDGTFTNRGAPTDVSGLSTGVIAIAAGPHHSCAVTRAGAVKCWGWNFGGQLGDGTTTSRPTPAPVAGLSSGVVAIAAGTEHSCALTSAGAVMCWGSNYSGEIGDGTRTDRLTPVPVSGLSSGVVAITAGGGHSCAITRAGAVKCWGWNEFFQLGDGTATNRLTPVPVSGLSSGVVAITGGRYHSCALTSVGAVMCWGSNRYGQLGDGTKLERATPVPASGLSSGVVAIALGVEHSCAATSAGDVKCWGVNFLGAVGDGTEAPWRTVPTPVLRLTALVRSRARLSTRALGVGAHSLKATYSGGATHKPSSGFRSQTIVP